MSHRVPTAVKRLRGTLRTDRAPAGEPTPPVLATRCPPWLPAGARRWWRRLAPGLSEAGIASAWDAGGLALLCVHLDLAIEAAQAIERDGLLVADPDHPAADGSTPKRKHPAAQLLRDQSAAVARWSAAFGLTPADRSRVSVTPEETPSLQELLSDWAAEAVTRASEPEGHNDDEVD